jgi:hypothetical protein
MWEIRCSSPETLSCARLPAMLRAGTRLRKIRIRIFDQLVFVSVAQLPLQIRLAAFSGRSGFLFDCSLMEIGVWL